MAKLRFFEKRNKNAASAPRQVRDYYSSTNGYTGQEVTAFSAVDIISNAFASLSFGVYDRKTHERKEGHWLEALIGQPNRDEPHNLFFSQIVRDWFDGGAFLYQYKNAEGLVVSLFRLNPREVRVRRDPVTNQKIFTYNGMEYTSDRILHIPSKYGYNGLVGRSIFDELRETFDVSKNLDSFTANTFNQNVGKRLVIDTSKAWQGMSDEQKALLEEKYINRYAGVRNAGRPIVKAGGIEFSTLDTGTSSNQSAQLAENRLYQSKLICEMFHIPPEFLIGGLPAEVESLYTVFVNMCIEPMATEFQEYFNLLLGAERGSVYFEFSYNSLMKTSLTRRVDAYAKELTNGILSVDEIRRRENLSELETEAAKTLLVPANLMPVRDDVFDAYMASAKEKLKGLNDTQNNGSADTHGVGDDKK